MLTRRIIPCLDIKNGKTVKGTNFVDLKDAGDPLELALLYSNNGADELVFLDITATEENRQALVKLVQNIASKINIPFTVGGGIKNLDNVKMIMDSGCDKISLNSAAIYNPKLISQIAKEYGSQALVLAIDAKQINGQWIVFTHGGKKQTTLNLFDWAKQVCELGAGEILFTSMDHDGIKNGFSINALDTLSKQISIPLIASGGAGTMQHFSDLFLQTSVNAALAASVFHFKEIEIPQLKKYLNAHQIPIRL